MTVGVTANPAYEGVRADIDRTAWTLGDPVATRAAILAIVDADEPPLRIPARPLIRQPRDRVRVPAVDLAGMAADQPGRLR